MRYCLPLLTILLLFSCTKEYKNIINIKSELPVVLPLIEEFNKNNKDIKAVLLSDSETLSWDITIGSRDYASENRTTNLTSLLKSIGEDQIYKDLLHGGYIEDELRLLPLNFDISGLIYSSKNKTNPRIISIEEFMNDKSTKFSPFWDTDFLIWYYISLIPNFSKNSNYYDPGVFYTAAQKASSIITNTNEEWDESEFNKKYLHLSPWSLVYSNTIEYYYMTFSNYIMSDYINKHNISFSFLSSNGLVITNEDINYIGVNRRSKRKKESETFIKWVLDSGNQNIFLENNVKEYGRTPLFLGKLSSLIQVNQEIIPLYYPKQAQFIPKSEIITTPKNLPPLWDTLKEQVFVPMFVFSRDNEAEYWNTKYNELFNGWLKKYKK